jgi:hypothetical protein
LIDAPVAVYRLHGGNVFSRRPQLNHVLCYEPGGAGDSNAKARAALVDHVVAHARIVLSDNTTLYGSSFFGCFGGLIAKPRSACHVGRAVRVGQPRS